MKFVAASSDVNLLVSGGWTRQAKANNHVGDDVTPHLGVKSPDDG